MGTEILRPQDCLGERVNPFHRRKNGYAVGGGGAFYPRNNRKQVKSPSAENLRHGGGWKHAELLMGRVTILRRGESMGSLNSKIHRDNKVAPPPNGGSGTGDVAGDDLVVVGIRRLGPEQPVMIPKQIRVSRSSGDVYAGSGFSNSPSPRSLPLPSFFNNANKKQDGSDTTSFDDSATRDLRRLLRLE
nr:RNA-binding protein 25-like [Ipomoea batatas]